eukprot:5151277-Pleurochrysis_carterae.AAC.1
MGGRRGRARVQEAGRRSRAGGTAALRTHRSSNASPRTTLEGGAAGEQLGSSPWRRSAGRAGR